MEPAWISFLLLLILQGLVLPAVFLFLLQPPPWRSWRPVGVAELQARGPSRHTRQMLRLIIHDHVQLVGAGGVLGSGGGRAEQARVSLGEDGVCGSLRESWRGRRRDPCAEFLFHTTGAIFLTCISLKWESGQVLQNPGSYSLVFFLDSGSLVNAIYNSRLQFYCLCVLSCFSSCIWAQKRLQSFCISCFQQPLQTDLSWLFGICF